MVGWLHCHAQHAPGHHGRYILGIIGAYVGNWLAGMVLGVTFGALDPRGIAMSVVGALLVAWIYKKVTGKSAH